jgi:CrcB protein
MIHKKGFEMSFTLSSALAIGAGATLGAWFRWFFAVLLNQYFPPMPLGTLLVNVIGGLLAGIVLALLTFGWFESQTLRLFVTTGFLGGLTTFSTFTSESLNLVQKHEYLWAIVHTSTHIVGALVFAAIGYALVHYFRT